MINGSPRKRERVTSRDLIPVSTGDVCRVCSSREMRRKNTTRLLLETYASLALVSHCMLATQHAFVHTQLPFVVTPAVVRMCAKELTIMHLCKGNLFPHVDEDENIRTAENAE